MRSKKITPTKQNIYQNRAFGYGLKNKNNKQKTSPIETVPKELDQQTFHTKTVTLPALFRKSTEKKSENKNK